MAKPRARIVIATDPKPPGRPKRCATEGCGFPVKRDNRYCGGCSGRILAALHASREWRTDDVWWNPETRANHTSLAVE